MNSKAINNFVKTQLDNYLKVNNFSLEDGDCGKVVDFVLSNGLGYGCEEAGEEETQLGGITFRDKESAKKFCIKNITIKYPDFLQTVVESALSVLGAVSLGPYLAPVLTILASMIALKNAYKVLEISLEPHDALILYATWKEKGTDEFKLKEIKKAVKHELKGVGRKMLSPEKLKHSINNLCRFQCLEYNSGTDKYKIRDEITIEF